MIEKTLSQLRTSGVRIALDDFGTGYSSMSYLRRYAIDKLKIDRSFVAELGSSSDADAIIRAMIAMARSLRLQVTAEGVETEAQRDHLSALGCHELQGYLLSRPLSETDLISMLRPPAEAPLLLRA
jgi:EAL domain-containing protein (putative c-di-GMP-specific phosphodiesterase class I)